MENLLPIGRFSKICKLSIKKLRHYDEIGLLKPAIVDNESAYRYYSLSQLVEAQRIYLLRSLDIPLTEIYEIMNEKDIEKIKEKLNYHKQLVKEKMKKYDMVIDLLEKLIDKGEKLMSYEVKIKETAAQPILYLSLFANQDDLQNSIHEAIVKLYKYTKLLGIKKASPPFTKYYDDKVYDDSVGIDVGVATERVMHGNDNIKSGFIESDKVVFTLHSGPYETIGFAYKSITEWVKERGHETKNCQFEYYFVNPGHTDNAQEFRTEIIIPIK